ncbi:MAG TPA: DUF6364 family protein [Rectinemataceae bacterium]
MRSKLTLTIDKRVVEKAKGYAKKKNRSVSKLVEEYLETVSANDSVSSATSAPKAEITDRITGMFMQEYEGQEYKDLLESALMENNT